MTSLVKTELYTKASVELADQIEKELQLIDADIPLEELFKNAISTRIHVDSTEDKQEVGS